MATDFSTDISKQANWVARKGNDNSLTINYTNNATPFDITLYTFAVYFFHFGVDPTVLSNAVFALTQGGGLTNGGALGTLRAVVTVANLATVFPDEYFWRAKVTHPDGTIHDWHNGVFRLQSELYDGELTNSIDQSIEVGGLTIDCDLNVTSEGLLVTNVDGGTPSSIYSYIPNIDGGTP